MLHNNKIFIILFLTAILSAHSQKSDNQFLSKFNAGYYSPKAISDIHPLNDGEHFATLSKDSVAILSHSFKTGKIVDTLFSVKNARECTIKKIEGFDLSKDETKLLVFNNKKSIHRFSFEADYYVYERKRNLIHPLSSGGKQQMATFSPNGRMIAFFRNGNIYLTKLDYGTESQITKDGEVDKISYGMPDWLYEEEFGLKKGFEWSPDNNYIAFLKFDQTNVSDYYYTLLKNTNPANKSLDPYPGIARIKYPKAGLNNPVVSIETFHIATKVTRKIELNDTDIEYIPRIRFTAQPDRLAIFTLNRQQNKFTIYTTHPGSGVCRVLIKDEEEKYYNKSLMDQITFLPDQIIYISEKDGHKHIYDYSPIGVMRRQVTKGEWDVTNFLGYNTANGVYYYESNEGSPLRNSLFAQDGKDRKTILSPTNGSSNAIFSANYHYFINTFSNTKTPFITDIRDISGKTMVVLEDNSELKSKLKENPLPTKEFFDFTSSKSVSLNGWFLKPLNFDPQKQYPVVMVQYSGSGSQWVKDSWDIDWYYKLTQRGYIVVCVDGRGTNGRGESFTKQTYLHLGLLEAEDQIETAKYLSKLPYINKRKISIWGWSYGGYTVLMSMSLGKGIFNAGVAVSPVTNWRLYDTAYTEGFMRTPSENNEGYELSDAGNYANQLQGNLLLIHGTADNNVHIQHTYEYTEKLVQAGKQFDMQIYSNRNHDLKGGNTRLHLYEKMIRFFDQNLKE